MSKRLIYTAILLFLIPFGLSASDTRPRLRRVCLDRVNMTATLYWIKGGDTCPKFLNYSIWGRDDVNGLFSLMGVEPSEGAGFKTISIPNLKRWQFFIVVRYGCYPNDSLSSDTLFVDDEEPSPMDLDSVSVDVGTQKLIAGWSKNTSSDLQGYLLYKVSGTNQIIADTSILRYQFQALNPRVTGNRIAISAYDSCGQAGLISAYHEPVLLRITDSVYCKRTFMLQFSPYTGWPVSRYDVFVKLKGSSTYSKHSSINPTGTLVYTLTLPKANEVYQTYVRAFHNNGIVSSSSNLVELQFDSLPTHSFSYVRTVSHKDDLLNIQAVYDNPNGNVTKARLLYSNNGSTWNLLSSGNSAPIVGSLTNKPPRLYSFRLQLEDACGTEINTSNISNNVVLVSNGNQSFSWNPYNSWLNGVGEYHLIAGTLNKDVSTWNIFDSYSSLPKEVTLPSTFKTNECFCVLAIETSINSLGYKDSSYSNIICPFTGLPVYIPNAFTPNNDGKNDYFIPEVSSLDPDMSNMKIFNRWGALVYENNLQQPWNGTTRDGVNCPNGVYAYIIDITYLSGEKNLFQGTISLLR